MTSKVHHGVVYEKLSAATARALTPRSIRIRAGRHRSASRRRSQPFFGIGFELILEGSLYDVVVPGLAFSMADFFGFFASRFDLCCPLAMFASPLKSRGRRGVADAHRYKSMPSSRLRQTRSHGRRRQSPGDCMPSA
jgi:hypothetical protein